MGSVRRRDPNDPKSPWVYEYTDPVTRKRHRKTPKSGLKKDAEALGRKVDREIDQGTHTADSASDTVAVICDRFISWMELRHKQEIIGRKHLDDVSAVIRRNVIPVLGPTIFTRLTFQQVEDWHRGLLDQGLSPLTAKRRLQQFKEVEDFARIRGSTGKTVIADVLRQTRGVKRQKIRTFTLEEARRLLVCADKRPPNFTERATAITRCFTFIAAFCGLRFGEIAGLTVGNVDVPGRVLRVRHNLTEYGELKGPKTQAGVRDVPMPAQVAEMLEGYLGQFTMENPLNLVFVSREGKPISASGFHNNYWRPLLRRAGLAVEDGSQIHFHALRHLATSLLVARLPPPSVAALIGHQHFDTTLQVYSHDIATTLEHQQAVETIFSAVIQPTA